MRHHGWFGMTARRRCPHAQLLGIYGDQINHVGGYRLQCVDCGRYLDGPVSLAATRPTNQHHRGVPMTWLVSHQHNGAPKTTSHTTEHAAEVEVRRVAASLPLGAAVVHWEIDDEREDDK